MQIICKTLNKGLSHVYYADGTPALYTRRTGAVEEKFTTSQNAKRARLVGGTYRIFLIVPLNESLDEMLALEGTVYGLRATDFSYSDRKVTDSTCRDMLRRRENREKLRIKEL